MVENLAPFARMKQQRPSICSTVLTYRLDSSNKRLYYLLNCAPSYPPFQSIPRDDRYCECPIRIKRMRVHWLTIAPILDQRLAKTRQLLSRHAIYEHLVEQFHSPETQPCKAPSCHTYNSDKSRSLVKQIPNSPRLQDRYFL